MFVSISKKGKGILWICCSRSVRPRSGSCRCS